MHPIALALLLMSSPATAAECNRSGTYHLTSGGPWQMQISTRAGATCEATFRSGSNMSFKRLLLVGAPERGRISLREGGFYIYTAPPTGGADAFMLRVCGVQMEKEGCADLKYTVTVN